MTGEVGIHIFVPLCFESNGRIRLYPARGKRLLRPLRSDNYIFILGQHKFTLMFPVAKHEQNNKDEKYLFCQADMSSV